ncbi:MAG: PDZ domain-containing protein, partial [Rhodobacterales bacterium]
KWVCGDINHHKKYNVTEFEKTHWFESHVGNEIMFQKATDYILKNYKSGDVIISFDGVKVADTRGLVGAVGNADVGKVVRVIVYRDGKTQTIKVTLGQREVAEKVAVIPEAKVPESIKEAEEMGMKLIALTEEVRAKLNLSDEITGVAVFAVDETSDAFEKGIRAGDLIVEAGQVKVTLPEDITNIFKEAKKVGRKSILLLVVRGDDTRFVGLSLNN